MALLLAAAQPADDCGRHRRYDLQPCEVRRDARNDILDAAGRPPARSLGPDALRLSRQPALGGQGLIVELVRDRRGGARGRVFILYGHSLLSWDVEDTHTFSLSRERYRELSDIVERAMRQNVPYALAEDEVRLCTDGPGLLTERVRGGTVVSLSGFCSEAADIEHPNRVIEAAVQDMLCRQRDSASRPEYWGRRRCFAPLGTMSQAQGEAR